MDRKALQSLQMSGEITFTNIFCRSVKKKKTFIDRQFSLYRTQEFQVFISSRLDIML